MDLIFLFWKEELNVKIKQVTKIRVFLYLFLFKRKKNQQIQTWCGHCPPTNPIEIEREEKKKSSWANCQLPNWGIGPWVTQKEHKIQMGHHHWALSIILRAGRVASN